MVASVIPTPYNHASLKRRKQTWYTIKDGNWSDPNVWASNGRRRYSYPSQSGAVTDDVFINHTITYDLGTSSTIQLNNLYVSGSFLLNSLTGRTLNISGDLQCTGTVDLTSTGTFTLGLGGVSNNINTFTCGSNSTVNYNRDGDQPIMNLSYRNLTLSGTPTTTITNATKYLTSDLTVLGNIVIGSSTGQSSAIFELGNYNLTVNGTLWNTNTIGNPKSTIKKSGSGAILSLGLFTSTGNIDFAGNPTVELRAGLAFTILSPGTFNSGTGTWSATTTTQTWTFTSVTYNFTAPVSIVGAITLNEAGTGIMQLNQPIDCTSASGSLVCKGTIYWNSTASLPSMTTGTIDRLTNANTIGYTMGASITLPYTTYWSLLITNSGVKTALGNTSLLGNLSLNTTVSSTPTPTFELSTFDLSVAGTTAVGTANFVPALLSKTGAGNVMFGGLLTVANTNGGAAATHTFIDFSVGNPTVDMRGGATFSNLGTVAIKTGTGQWSFTTNNQSLTGSGAGGLSTWKFDGAILISGAITVTIVNFPGTLSSNTLGTDVSTTGNIKFYSTVNGNNVASKLLLGTGTPWVDFYNITTPMLTGIFDRTTNANTVGYAFDGDFTLPDTSISGLYIGGSGTKSLAGNTTLTGNLYLGANTGYTIKLECGIYNLTVNGTTTSGSSITGQLVTSTISKTGAGSVLFIGVITSGNSNQGFIDFSGGNPTVELRGGLTVTNGSVNTFKTGTSTWTISTNNQTFTFLGTQPPTVFDAPILISGAITLTMSSTSALPVFKSEINGNNAASTLDNRISNGGLNYQATQRPMLTGVLQTNAAANTFLYNKAGNQDVQGGTYRTLTLGGTATPNNKILQGNIVVATAYSTTGNAALVLNGFTKT